MTADNDRVLRDILVHVGETRKGMQSLEGDVGGIREQIQGLNRTAVPKEECTARHVVVARSVDGVKKELRDDLQQIKADVRAIKVRTGAEHPVLTAKMLTNGGNGCDNINGPPTEGKGVKYWLGVITAGITIVGFLGGMLWGVFRVGRYMERVDQTILQSAKGQKKLQTTMNQVATQEPRVIYVQVPVHPDAGPTRRPRRRVRRSRRTQ